MKSDVKVGERVKIERKFPGIGACEPYSQIFKGEVTVVSEDGVSLGNTWVQTEVSGVKTIITSLEDETEVDYSELEISPNDIQAGQRIRIRYDYPAVAPFGEYTQFCEGIVDEVRRRGEVIIVDGAVVTLTAVTSDSPKLTVTLLTAPPVIGNWHRVTLLSGSEVIARRIRGGWTPRCDDSDIVWWWDDDVVKVSSHTLPISRYGIPE